jgi:hypothetical protein
MHSSGNPTCQKQSSLTDLNDDFHDITADYENIFIIHTSSLMLCKYGRTCEDLLLITPKAMREQPCRHRWERTLSASMGHNGMTGKDNGYQGQIRQPSWWTWRSLPLSRNCETGKDAPQRSNYSLYSPCVHESVNQCIWDTYNVFFFWNLFCPLRPPIDYSSPSRRTKSLNLHGLRDTHISDTPSTNSWLRGT